MLVLTRKVGERIFIGNGIEVVVCKVQGDRVRIGIVAPAEIAVNREEVHIKEHGRDSGAGGGKDGRSQGDTPAPRNQGG